MSSRLFQKIREEHGMAYSVYSYPTSYSDTGYFTLYAGTGEKQAAKVVELMLREIDSVKKDGITKEEFARSKQQLKGNYLLGLESTASRSSSLGRGELRGRIYTDEELIRRIEGSYHGKRPRHHSKSTGHRKNGGSIRWQGKQEGKRSKEDIRDGVSRI